MCVDENLHSLDRFGVIFKYIFFMSPEGSEGKYWQASTQLQNAYVYVYILIEYDGEHLMEIVKLAPIFYVGQFISFCLSDGH